MLKFYCLNLIFHFLLFQISSSTIIIVGTGPAGIAAATKLLKNNVTDILILEAENRIGGRINSVEFGNAIVDLGAEWCHGQGNNIVYDLIKDYSILGHTEYVYNLFYSNGQQINVNLSTALFEIIDKIYSPDGNKKQNEDIVLGDYCVNKYLTEIQKLQLNDTDDIKVAKEFQDYFQHYVISSEGSFSWFEPSAESDYRSCSGDLAQNWNGYGFKTILDLLMQKFPNTSTPLPIDDKIIFNKEVKKIVWDSKDDGVIVKCSDGSWYHGEQLIFTPSLGVLKENYRTMFEPPLPQEKQRAIERLGIGAVMKAMLMFSRKWWPEDVNALNVLWSVEHNSEKLKKFTKNGKIWILDSLVFVTVENNPNVLSLWLVGRSVPDIEEMNDTEFLDGVCFIIDTFFGKTYNVSYPVSYIKTNWYTNRHFRGTYSYQTIGSRKTTSNEDLAKPLLNRNGKTTLMFAGEASHPYYYSTVHGAIETGHREADRILKILNVL